MDSFRVTVESSSQELLQRMGSLTLNFSPSQSSQPGERPPAAGADSVPNDRSSRPRPQASADHRDSQQGRGSASAHRAGFAQNSTPSPDRANEPRSQTSPAPPHAGSPPPCATARPAPSTPQRPHQPPATPPRTPASAVGSPPSTPTRGPAQSARSPRRTPAVPEKWYTVTQGLAPGIYSVWEDVVRARGENIHRKKCVFKKHSSLAEAETAYAGAEAYGQIVCHATPETVGLGPTSARYPPPGTPLPPPPPRRQDSYRWYVVGRGRKTGIFEYWENVKDHIIGFHRAESWGYDTREEAEAKYAECFPE
ncbi:hypothetical protein BV25DRAFT_1917700 [Artomyces pyxidatus]|uniref:Uncharacterized protein n=1 Tax=Artomyces pyxidatus TaxID=48021 RepID=A0ACB8SV46_9AGAM|nr:hypothetical protein BV25DRAFT_1917700 [Artomyces pyxidatus]